MGPVFLYFFQDFPNFQFRGVSISVRLALGLQFGLRLDLPFAFTMFLPSLLQSHCTLQETVE